MNEYMQFALDHFHAEMDLILATPGAFFGTLVVIAVLEYIVIRLLLAERFQAQKARINFLSAELARMSSSEPLAGPAIANFALLDRSPSSVAAPIAVEPDPLEVQRQSHEPLRAETAQALAEPQQTTGKAPAHESGTTAVEDTHAPLVVQKEPLELESLSTVTSLDQPPVEATEQSPPQEADVRTFVTDVRDEPAGKRSKLWSFGRKLSESPSQELAEAEDAQSESVAAIAPPREAIAPALPAITSMPTAVATPPRLNISILNLHEGARVGPTVELEVLASTSIERLQAWVYSAQTQQWYPQEPFWQNRGILIATCYFGDDKSRPGDTFRLSIIETEQPLAGPIPMLPRDVPQSKVFTLTRA